MKKHLQFLIAACCLASGALAADGRYEPKWDSLDKRPCPEWFLDAKFGIFIHWGVYSVPAWGAPKQYAEWYWQNMSNKKPDNLWWQFHKKNFGENFDYQDFAPQFRCELFNADQWADIFARSGARYIVPTSKHHEGFCLWPSAEASKTWGRPWNAVEIGPKRDLMAEMKAAVEKRGVKFGFYYSLYEWFNPLWKNKADRPRYVAGHMFPQFKDVVTRYKPFLIFSDGEWDMQSVDWRSEELLAWLFNESPCKDYVVVNDRWGKDCRHKHGGYYTTEYAAGMKDASHPWEESRGMAHSYGYNRAETIDDYKTAREFIMVLCDLVSRGGNFLLDIGPTADGRIPVIMQQRLLEIGDWLRVNGEAIYGTRHAGRDCQWTEGKRPGQQFGEYMVKYNLMEQVGQKAKGGIAVKQIFFTKKSDALYAITAGWPGSKFVVKNIKVPAKAAVTLLGCDAKVKSRVSGKDLLIEPPVLAPDALPRQHAFTFKIAGAELLPEP
ncbi:MAG: alpha-L-fucosidase [Verrucomicrobia bacterium]|nr:alpha-L-fucosidase [Verrucomicrobiota bacterium]